MRSHCPDIPAIRLLWTIMTPLGLPVEPLVYITIARSEGWGFTIGLPTAMQTQLLCCSPMNLFFLGGWRLINQSRDTHYSEAELPALVQPACCGWKVLLGNRLGWFSSGPRRSRASVLGSVEAHSEQKKSRCQNRMSHHMTSF